MQFGENSDKGWKKSTLSTFLSRMKQKGVISVRYEGEKRFEKRRSYDNLYMRESLRSSNEAGIRDGMGEVGENL